MIYWPVVVVALGIIVVHAAVAKPRTLEERKRRAREAANRKT